MKKLILSAALSFVLGGFIFAQSDARQLTLEASRKASVDESIIYLKNQVSKISDPVQKRAIYIFMASLQEQMSFYIDAQISYASAASIAARTLSAMAFASFTESTM